MKVNLLCVPQGVIGEKGRERSGIRPGVVQPVQVRVSQTTSGHASLLAPLQGLFFDGEGTSDERERPWALIVMFTEIYFKELRGRTGQQDGWRKLLKRPECAHSKEWFLLPVCGPQALSVSDWNTDGLKTA